MRLNECHADPYLTLIRTVIERRGCAGEAWLVAASPSIYYPGGGGQPPDVGAIGAAKILGTSDGADGETLYHLDQDVPDGPAFMTIDGARRRDHREQHSAQHLVSHLIERVLHATTVSFHMKGGELFVDRPCLEEGALREVESEANRAIQEARRVEARVEDSSNGVQHREVEIEGIGRAACGGTHVRSTAELQLVALVGQRPDVVRLVAGSRALQALRDGLRRDAELTRLLSAPPVDHIRTIQGVYERATAAKRGVEQTRRDYSRAIAAMIEQHPGPSVWRIPFTDPTLLRGVGHAVRETLRERAVLLISNTSGPSGAWVLVAPVVHANQIGVEVARLLGGRGGGKNSVFFGDAPDGSRLGEVEDYLSRMNQSTPECATKAAERESQRR